MDTANMIVPDSIHQLKKLVSTHAVDVAEQLKTVAELRSELNAIKLSKVAVEAAADASSRDSLIKAGMKITTDSVAARVEATPEVLDANRKVAIKMAELTSAEAVLDGLHERASMIQVMSSLMTVSPL